MHDKFEQDVRGKMDGVQLPPSAPVWEKVELAIRPKKRKRRIIFWILFAALVAGSGWWGYEQLFINGKEKVAKTGDTKPAMKEEVVNETIPSNPQSQSVQTSESKASVNKKDTMATSSSNKEIQSSYNSQASRRIAETISSSELKNDDKLLVDGRNNDSKKIDERLDIINLTSSAKTTESTADVRGSIPKLKLPISSKTQPVDTLAKAMSGIPSDSSSVTDSAAKSNPQPSIAIVDSAAKKKLATNKKGWKKIVSLQTGSSSITGNSISANSSLSGLPNNLSGVFVPPAFVSSAQSVQKPSPGLAFTASFGIERLLSQKIAVGFGIEYTYASSQIKTGVLQNASATVRFDNSNRSVQRYYTAGTTSGYTNRYHTAGLPVWFRYQPLRIPLSFVAGAGYRYIVSTNALTYSRAANLWYENSDNNIRHQLPLSLSIQYGFRVGTSMSITAGPHYEHNATRLQQEDVWGSSHLRFIGLKTSLRF